MKNFIKSLAVMAAAAVMVLGLGTHKADASGVDFRVGLNFGVPVVAAPVYSPAHVYSPQPARVYQVEKARYVDGYGYQHGYRNDRFGHDRGWHRGWYGDHRGSDRNYHDRWGR